MTVYVALRQCGCVFAADALGDDQHEWIELGYRIEIRNGPVTIPELCPMHEEQLQRAHATRLGTSNEPSEKRQKHKHDEH